MPLSDHEQRMLDQIESALYAEDPKFASSVRGGGLRAPTARRRLQGAALFVLGLGMVVSGVAFKATMIGTFPILSVVGFIVMFGGVVFAITGPRRARVSAGARVPAVPSPAGWKIGSAAASRNSVTKDGRAAVAALFVCAGRAAARYGDAAPRLPLTHCAPLCRYRSSSGFELVILGRHAGMAEPLSGRKPAETTPFGDLLAVKWDAVGDCGVWWRKSKGVEVARCFSAPTHPSSTTKGG